MPLTASGSNAGGHGLDPLVDRARRCALNAGLLDDGRQRLLAHGGRGLQADIAARDVKRRPGRLQGGQKGVRQRARQRAGDTRAGVYAKN